MRDGLILFFWLALGKAGNFSESELFLILGNKLQSKHIPSLPIWIQMSFTRLVHLVKHSACKHKDLSSIARMNVGRKNKTHQAHQNKLTISVLGWQGKADPWDLLTSITNLINSRSVRGLSQKTGGS